MMKRKTGKMHSDPVAYTFAYADIYLVHHKKNPIIS